jgi:ABC-type bacteriocin/lantibiotic exporter with double-glycine peptidase domain
VGDRRADPRGRGRARAVRAARSASPLERGISIESVALERDGRKLFEELSLEIPSGRITAVIGASGSARRRSPI